MSTGATAISTDIFNGGSVTVTTGGTAKAANIAAGGIANIQTGGLAVDTIINNGGKQILDAGTGSNVTINSGGSQILSNTATANNANIKLGGVQVVSSGAIASATNISAGGMETISAGGKSLDAKIYTDANQVIDGGSANNTSITGGTQTVTNNGTVSLASVTNSGTQILSNGGRALDTKLDNGTQLVANTGTAERTIVNNNAVQQVVLGGSAIGAVINSGGSQMVNSGAKVTDTSINNGGYVKVAADAQATGTTTNNGGILDLTTYNQNNTSIAGTLGTVLVADPSPILNVGRNVTIASLSGSQTFVMNTDLEHNNSDLVTITGNVSGTHYIKIGREVIHGSLFNSISQDHITKVVDINGGGGSETFIGALSPIDGVNIIPRIVQIGEDWYIMGSQSIITGPSKLAITAEASSQISYAAMRSTMSSLQRRLGEIKDNTHDTGLWARIYGGEHSVQAAKLKHITLQGGYDWVKTAAKGRFITGVTIENQTATTSYTDGNGKLTNTRIGVYHTWLGNSGHYYDLVAQTGKLGNKFTVYDNGSVIDANYRLWNTTVSAEYGYTKQLKQGFYIKPQVQVTYSKLSGGNYQATGGTSISQVGINSLIARFGASIGRKLDNVNYYLTASVLHEFTAKDKVTTGIGTYSSTLEHSFKGTTVELSFGGNIQTGKNSNIYLEATHSLGGKVSNKWQGQIGYRYNF